jgi:hypothetical protein
MSIFSSSLIFRILIYHIAILLTLGRLIGIVNINKTPVPHEITTIKEMAQPSKGNLSLLGDRAVPDLSVLAKPDCGLPDLSVLARREIQVTNLSLPGVRSRPAVGKRDLVDASQTASRSDERKREPVYDRRRVIQRKSAEVGGKSRPVLRHKEGDDDKTQKRNINNSISQTFGNALKRREGAQRLIEEQRLRSYGDSTSLFSDLMNQNSPQKQDEQREEIEPRPGRRLECVITDGERHLFDMYDPDGLYRCEQCCWDKSSCRRDILEADCKHCVMAGEKCSYSWEREWKLLRPDPWKPRFWKINGVRRRVTLYKVHRPTAGASHTVSLWHELPGFQYPYLGDSDATMVDLPLLSSQDRDYLNRHYFRTDFEKNDMTLTAFLSDSGSGLLQADFNLSERVMEQDSIARKETPPLQEPAMFIHYTISEDRSGNQNEFVGQILARLGEKDEKKKKSTNPFGDQDGDAGNALARLRERY